MNNDPVLSALYDTHAQAEQAVKKLQASGYNLQNLSIVGQEYHTEEKVVGYYNLGDRMLSWGSTGAFWGGIWSLLFGSAFFLVPG
ncbi:general stress protein [Hymenobacter sp. BRD128]|uniref:general stress protein n=1 Tax=Hymenobacter sp. BRD128 TaxID=2675878 RepID=UPI0020B8746C|nr:general stress protein [Hymenobacter sp. BRD128]